MQRVDLFLEDWWRDPQSAVGKYPVLVTDQGTIWALTIAVVHVAVVEQPHDNVRAWAVTAGTQRGDYDAVIGTSVVTEQASGHDLATVKRLRQPRRRGHRRRRHR